jgi:hypothetical protein
MLWLSDGPAQRTIYLMEAAIWGFVGVLAGGIITGFVTIRAESMRADKEASLDSAKRQNDRKIVSDNFQRENLLSLQDAFDALTAADSAGFELNLEASNVFGELRPWPADFLSRYHMLDASVRHLMQRVLDDDLRSLIDGYRDVAFAQENDRSDEITATGAEVAMMATAMALKAVEVDEKLGEVLRKLL